MKYIKSYENISNYENTAEIKIGDFVKLKISKKHYSDRYAEYVNSNTGIIIKLTNNNGNSIKQCNLNEIFRFDVEFLNKNKDYDNIEHRFSIDKISEFAQSKEELETKLTANKYNL